MLGDTALSETALSDGEDQAYDYIRYTVSFLSFVSNASVSLLGEMDNNPLVFTGNFG